MALEVDTDAAPEPMDLATRVASPLSGSTDDGSPSGSPAALLSASTHDIREGDVLTIAKKGSSHFGESVTVVNPDWNGMVKVTNMDGEVKSFNASDLALANVSDFRSKYEGVLGIEDGNMSPRAKKGRIRLADASREMFVQMDTSGDGDLDLLELDRALEESGLVISGECRMKLLDEIDGHGDSPDGNVSIDEFVSFILGIRACSVWEQTMGIWKIMFRNVPFYSTFCFVIADGVACFYFTGGGDIQNPWGTIGAIFSVIGCLGLLQYNAKHELEIVNQGEGNRMNLVNMVCRLARTDGHDLAVGDTMIVIKEGSKKGRRVTVLDTSWNGLVRVDMDGEVKAYKAAMLAHPSGYALDDEEQEKEKEPSSAKPSPLDLKRDAQSFDQEVETTPASPRAGGSSPSSPRAGGSVEGESAAKRMLHNVPVLGGLLLGVGSGMHGIATGQAGVGDAKDALVMRLLNIEGHSGGASGVRRAKQLTAESETATQSRLKKLGVRLLMQKQKTPEDQDSDLNLTEWKLLLQTCNIMLSDSVAKQIFDEVDVDATGSISEDELLNHLSKLSTLSTMQKAILVLRKLERSIEFWCLNALFVGCILGVVDAAFYDLDNATLAYYGWLCFIFGAFGVMIMIWKVADSEAEGLERAKCTLRKCAGDHFTRARKERERCGDTSDAAKTSDEAIAEGAAILHPLIDRDGDGMEVNELSIQLAKENVVVPPDALDKIFGEIDVDHNRTVTASELITYIVAAQPCNASAMFSIKFWYMVKSKAMHAMSLFVVGTVTFAVAEYRRDSTTEETWLLWCMIGSWMIQISNMGILSVCFSIERTQYNAILEAKAMLLQTCVDFMHDKEARDRDLEKEFDL